MSKRIYFRTNLDDFNVPNSNDYSYNFLPPIGSKVLCHYTQIGRTKTAKLLEVVDVVYDASGTWNVELSVPKSFSGTLAQFLNS